MIEAKTRTSAHRLICECGCEKPIDKGQEYVMVKRDGWHYPIRPECSEVFLKRLEGQIR